MSIDGSAPTGKSLAIVGGGIAGLCAGCYAQMNGYRSRIYEMHDLPGGLMTAWERKGYTIDYCIQWLVGANPLNAQEAGMRRDPRRPSRSASGEAVVRQIPRSLLSAMASARR